MDHGKLTDHNGKQIDFRNVIIIMTTNAGAADLARAAFGFTRMKREGDDTEAINRLFSPEFRNRLDAIISFAHLPKEVVAKVVDKFILQLEVQLADRQVTIELSDEARDWLVEHGYDEAMGARPLARLIQTMIKTPLADQVLFGHLKNGGAVRVVVNRAEDGFDSLGLEFPGDSIVPKPEKTPSSSGRAGGAKKNTAEQVPSRGGNSGQAGQSKRKAKGGRAAKKEPMESV